MIITVKNPIDNSDVEIEVNVSTNLITNPDGSQDLSVGASGFISLKGPTETLIETN
jgi:hypothetical protein